MSKTSKIVFWQVKTSIWLPANFYSLFSNVAGSFYSMYNSIKDIFIGTPNKFSLLTYYIIGGDTSLRVFPFGTSDENNFFASITQLEAMKNDTALRSRFIERYINFIISAASRIKGSYIQMENDEEFSVAIAAFNRAIDLYDPERGASFLTFAGLLIKRDIIDFYRKKRTVKEIPISQLHDSDDNLEYQSENVGESIRIQEHEFNLRQEIGIYKALLREYSLTFSQLTTASPKQANVRKRLVALAIRLNEDPVAKCSIIKRKMLPIKDMESWSGLSRKTLERHRRYILASFILINSDLNYLKDYLKDYMNGGDNA